MTAMCTGDKTALSPDVTFGFRQAGLSHLLAVSGLHMAILAQAVLGLLRFLRVPRRWAALGAAGVVVPFMLLTGMTPSVVRSGVMCLVLLAGQLLRRRADSRNSLGFALLLLVLPNPYVVLDVGLQLSFAATVGLVALGPWMQDKAFAWLRRGRPEEWKIPGWGAAAHRRFVRKPGGHAAHFADCGGYFRRAVSHSAPEQFGGGVSLHAAGRVRLPGHGAGRGALFGLDGEGAAVGGGTGGQISAGTDRRGGQLAVRHGVHDPAVPAGVADRRAAADAAGVPGCWGAGGCGGARRCR